MRFHLSSMRTRVEVVSASPDGTLRLSARGMRIAYDIARLGAEDIAALAAAVGD